MEKLPGEVGRIEVEAAGGGYPVVVGYGLLDALPRVLASVAQGRRVAVVSDSHVDPLHAARVRECLEESGIDAYGLTFPAGEASKTRKTWSILTDRLLEAGLGRDSCVVAVGGGVTTDLAGFVAATYLRGVPVVQCPTSYLAMIDASVGGKTGVDVRAGKNLVGAFHPPLAVVADVDVLTTLPIPERAQGLVEAVKHGAILDEDHFERIGRDVAALLEASPEDAASLVLESVRIKADVVSRDEFEGGYRQVLNFGHTVGHAIEAAADFALGHGSAVALGMLAEAELGERMGVTVPGTRERLAGVLERLLTDLALPDTDAPAFDFLAADKKSREGHVRYVLLERIGRCAAGDGWTYEAPEALVAEVLSSLHAA